MSRTLTEEQTKKLFAFLTKQEIYDYDLQIEIIDHLASSIEEQWGKNPELGFGWALKNATSKFGKNGFRKLERKITRQLSHKFNRVLWRYFLEFFSLPKILITTCLCLFIFTLLQLVTKNTTVLFFYCIPISIASIYYHYKVFPEKIAITPSDGKSFLILKHLQLINSRVGPLVQLPFQVLIFSNLRPLVYSNTLWEELVISIVLALLTVFLYGYFFFLPQKIREYFLTNYAEFAQ